MHKICLGATIMQFIRITIHYKYTKVSDKIAYENSSDPDQTAPSSLMRVYTVSSLTNSFKKQLHRKHKSCQKTKQLAGKQSLNIKV